MAEGNQIQVRLVTPDSILVDQGAAAVELPGLSGYMEVLPGHAPLLSELGSGEVRIHGGEAGEQKYHVSWGFVEVLPERVTILADEAEKPEKIDVAAAKEELDRVTRCGTKRATAKRSIPGRTKSSPTRNRSWPAPGVRDSSRNSAKRRPRWPPFSLVQVS